MSDYFRVGRGLDSSAVSCEVEPGPDATISLLCLFSLRYDLTEKWRNQHFGTLCLCFLFFLFVVVRNTCENNISMLSHFSFEAEILEVLAVGGFSGLYILKYVGRALKSFQY